MILNKPAQIKRKEHFHVFTGIFLIAAILMLGGCNGVLEIHQTINATGYTNGYADGTFDLTELYEQQNAPVSNYPSLDAEAKDPICKQISSSLNTTDVTCNLHNAILTFNGTLKEKQLNESDGFFIKHGFFAEEYSYSLDSNKLLSENSSRGLNQSQLADFRAKGIVLKYFIEMPGILKDIVGGKITIDKQGKKVAEIDMIDVLLQGGTITITSREFTLLLGFIMLGAMALIAAMPLLFWLINRKGEKSVYKDKPGTLIFMFFFMPLCLMMFMGSAFAFFDSEPGYEAIYVTTTFFFSMAFGLIFLQYLGTDFQVTENGVMYKVAFAKQTIPFSQITKIERAKVGLSLNKEVGLAYLVTTTSGTKIKPTHLVKGNGRRWNTGVLITQKNGTTIYYPVLDDGWVIDAVKERI